VWLTLSVNGTGCEAAVITTGYPFHSTGLIAHPFTFRSRTSALQFKQHVEHVNARAAKLMCRTSTTLRQTSHTALGLRVL